MQENLKPLVNYTHTWKTTQDDKEAFVCFQQCVNVLKSHYDSFLNSTKTDWKFGIMDPKEKSQRDCEYIIDFIANSVCIENDDINALKGALGVEMSRYVTHVFREAQRKRVHESSKESTIEEDIRFMNVKDDQPEVDLNEKDKEEEEEEKDEDISDYDDDDDDNEEDEDEEEEEDDEEDEDDNEEENKQEVEMVS